jgi:VanZ family protein
VAVYCLLVFLLSSISSVPALPGGMSDKTAHVLLYAGLGALTSRALAGGSTRPLRAGLATAAVAFAIVYGFSDECHQLFVPRRQFDLRDLAADAVGGLLGTGAWWAWGILWRLRDAV